MKRLLNLAACAAFFVLAGCASTQSDPNSEITPSQIAQRVCPPVQGAVQSLRDLDSLSAVAQEKLAVASPIVDAACSGTESLDVSSFRALSVTALPALLEVVEASPLAEQDKNRIAISVTGAEMVLGIIFQAPAASR